MKVWGRFNGRDVVELEEIRPRSEEDKDWLLAQKRAYYGSDWIVWAGDKVHDEPIVVGKKRRAYLD